jgi:hypothetical protein
MKYLLHLKDVVESSLSGVEHGLVVITSLLEWNKERVDQNTDDSMASNQIKLDFKVLDSDLTFLKAQLNGILKNIEQDEALLRNRFQLTQDSRLFRLTVFAGIFLPLSFTTSIFGMNMNSDTPNGPEGFSDWTTESLNGLAPETRNMTEILASTALTSQTLSYPWKTFAITSACLLMTLPFSLAIGAILRTMIGGAALSAVYWRGGVVLIGFFFFFLSVAGQYYVDIYSWVVANAVLIILLWYMCIRKWKQKIFWFFWLPLTTLTILLYVLELAVTDLGGGFMIGPWAILLLRVFFIVRGRRMRLHKAAEDWKTELREGGLGGTVEAAHEKRLI